MKSFIRIVDALSTFVGGAAALIVIPLVLATCYEVFARYFLGSPTIWAFELGYILMGLHFLLGGAITLLGNQHVRIDLIYARLSPRRRAMIDLTFYVALVLPALAMICVHFWDHMFGAFMSGEASGQSAWNPPIWPFRAIILGSFVLLTLQVMSESAKCILTLMGRPISRKAV